MARQELLAESKNSLQCCSEWNEECLPSFDMIMMSSSIAKNRIGYLELY